MLMKDFAKKIEEFFKDRNINCDFSFYPQRSINPSIRSINSETFYNINLSFDNYNTFVSTKERDLIENLNRTINLI